jgi:predicted protein tyrosine phosphatase
MSALMNRLANCHNKYQGPFKRVLCVCSAGLLRSPTIAWVLSNEPYNCNVRVVGAVTEYALVPVDQALIEWADEIVCAEEEHANAILRMLKKWNVDPDSATIRVLGVPDQYPFRAPELVDAIKAALTKLDFKGTLQE